MPNSAKESLIHKLKLFFIGDARDFKDKRLFHNITLIALFAWIGLGADGLSSSCYGPPEAFIALGKYHYLGIFVALGTVITITVISISYSRIIELFPSGGGGYLVASKLHSPFVGMISGSALLIDYVLTISVSIASGTDALFSFFPQHYGSLKIWVAIAGIIALVIINLRGAKESISILAPIFIVFVLTHIFAIGWTFVTHLWDISSVNKELAYEISRSQSQLGFFGMIFLILRAFSMGAGTFTGIEAVSNGLPILREPRVRTGQHTMVYMASSLAITAFGLMVSYLLLKVAPEGGKTLNAVFFERIVSSWGSGGYIFVLVTLISEAAILFVAAQAGIIAGPRILSNMAIDRWMPAKFAFLSDRLVTKNGIVIIGTAAIAIILLTGGRIDILIVLYSINVFITFILTESGMCRHWWRQRHTNSKWIQKISIHIIAFCLDAFILTTIIIMKFTSGGWATILVTGALIALSSFIKSHYLKAGKRLKKFNQALYKPESNLPFKANPELSKELNGGNSKTAILLVNGYNGLGLTTLFKMMTTFGNIYNKYVFVHVGLVDAGNYKGVEDVESLEKYIHQESMKYVNFMKNNDFEAECYTNVGIDIIEEIEKLIIEVRSIYKDSVIYGGQIVFEQESFWTRLLHNNIVFTLQKRFYLLNIPFVVIPVKIE